MPYTFIKYLLGMEKTENEAKTKIRPQAHVRHVQNLYI
jgi:hypothetical protein